MRKIAASSKAPSRIALSLLRRRQVVAERLLDDDAGAVAQPDLASCSTTSPNSTGGIAR